MATEFTNDELRDLYDAVARRADREHNRADETLRDESKSGEAREKEASAYRQHGNRLGALKRKIGEALTISVRGSERAAEFLAWLKSEGINFALIPTPEKMLKSPDSLTVRQRAWLTAFLAEGEHDA